MKIGIVTVFKSDNCGSFLQAWALKEQLEAMGHDVYFCDYKIPLGARINGIKVLLKCCLRGKFKSVIQRLRKASDFKRFQKNLKKMPLGKEDADMYFIGSDTLWNFNDNFFRGNWDFFTGVRFNKPCYTYAISIASTEKDVFLKNEKITDGIKRFEKIAVRDEYTEHVLSAFYPIRNIVSTVDPTLLFDKNTYVDKFRMMPVLGKKSLVIYYFGIIPSALRAELDDFARERNLNVVEVGIRGNKADISLVQSPANFITAFAEAEYIFTNTFHGCVFSTIFNKQFATDGLYKKKVESFLGQLGLLDRYVSDAADFKRVMTAPIDYESVNAIIKRERENSISYLDNVIREVECNE